MATRDQLVSICTRITKTSGDPVATAAFVDDINDAIRIVASLRDFVELWREGNIDLLSTDGDKSYALNSDVSKVYQLRVISPDSYIRGLEFWKNFEYWEWWPTKANQGTSPVTAWYFTAPTTNTDGSSIFNVSFDHKPDQAYTVRYSYKVKAPSLTSGNSVPFFDENFHDILCDYAIWRYAEREADPSLNPNYWAVKWENSKREMLNGTFTRQREQTPIPGP